MRVDLQVVTDPEVPGCADVYVEFSVAGRAVQGVLDSGALVTQLVRRPPGSVGLGVVRQQGVFGESQVERIEVHDVRLGSLHAATMTADLVVSSQEAENLVGLDVLSAGTWTLDLDARTLTIGEVNSESGRQFLRGRKGHVLAELRWPGANALGCWDTGAGITLVDRRFAAGHPHLFLRRGATHGTDVGGRPGVAELAEVSGYVLAGVAFADHVVAIADLPRTTDPLDVILGYPTLRQARWTVDVRSGRWSVQRLRG